MPLMLFEFQGIDKSDIYHFDLYLDLEEFCQWVTACVGMYYAQTNKQITEIWDSGPKGACGFPKEKKLPSRAKGALQHAAVFQIWCLQRARVPNRTARAEPTWTVAGPNRKTNTNRTEPQHEPKRETDRQEMSSQVSIEQTRFCVPVDLLKQFQFEWFGHELAQNGITSTSEHNSLELNRFCEPKPSEKVIPKCVVSTRTGPKGQKGITSTSEQDSLELNSFCEPKPPEKVIPNCVVSTRTGQKRYYFHIRAKQLGTEPFLYP